MAGISNYAQGQLLQVVFNKNVTIPSTWYIALLTSAATSSNTGSTIVEPTAAQYSGYARIASPNNTSNWSTSTPGQNVLTVTFPTSGGGASSPVSIVGAAVCDALTTGNLWFFGLFGTPLSVGSGQAPFFSPGDIDFSVS